MKPTPEELAEYDRLAAEDVERWDNGELGSDPAFAQRVSPELEQEFHRQKRTRTVATSIRLSETLIEALKTLAKEDNIGYQTYVKQVLSRHVKAEAFKHAPKKAYGGAQ